MKKYLKIGIVVVLIAIVGFQIWINRKQSKMNDALVNEILKVENMLIQQFPDQVAAFNKSVSPVPQATAPGAQAPLQPPAVVPKN